MKFIKFMFFLLFFVIFAAIAGIYVFFKTVDVQKYQPKIAEQLSRVVGRPVSTGALTLKFSVSEGLIVGVKDLSIAEAPGFEADGPFLTASNIEMDANLLHFIKTREVLVSRVSLESPKIQIIRAADGTLNVSQFGAAETPSGEAPATPTAAPAAEAPAAPAGSPNLPDVLVQSIVLSNGTIIVEDRARKNPLKLVTNNLDLQVQQFSMNKSFPFHINGGFLTADDNFDIEGQTLVNIAGPQVRLDDIRYRVNFSAIPLATLEAMFTGIADLKVTDLQMGVFEGKVSQMVAGPAGLELLAMDGNWSGGTIASPKVSVPLEALQAKFSVSEVDVENMQFSARFGQGTLSGSGRIDDYLNRRRFNIKLATENIQVGDFLGAVLPGLSFTGILNTQLNVKGEDFSLEALAEKLEAEGAMTMTEGFLRDMNLFREVVTRIGVIPDLQQKLLASLPPSYQDKLKLNDTPFPQIELAVAGEGLSLDVNKALIQSEDFMLEGSGRYGWPDDLVVRRGTALVLGEEFSRAMVAAVEEFDFLMTEDGFLRIPLKSYEGSAREYKPRPDVEEFARSLLKTEGRKQINRLLDKALDRDQEPAAEGAAPADGGDAAATEEGEAAPQQKPPEQELIEGVLDQIFGK